MREKRSQKKIRKKWRNGKVSKREVPQETEQSLSLSPELCVCVWVCPYVWKSVALFMFECVTTVQNSHTAHIAPGLYPCNCRSQSDIVLLWLLSMVLHISPEMTKSLSQCSWPPASLLVLLHSHSLMWPWIGIGHQPHSRDWYRLCCSHAYRSSELSGRLASVWLSVCVSCLLSSTKMGGTVSAITLKIEVPIQMMFKLELVGQNAKTHKMPWQSVNYCLYSWGAVAC